MLRQRVPINHSELCGTTETPQGAVQVRVCRLQNRRMPSETLKCQGTPMPRAETKL